MTLSCDGRIEGVEVFTHGGKRCGFGRARVGGEAERLGAGEILLTAWTVMATTNGYDLELTRAISSAVRIPVIASGGAGTLEHFMKH